MQGVPLLKPSIFENGAVVLDMSLYGLDWIRTEVMIGAVLFMMGKGRKNRQRHQNEIVGESRRIESGWISLGQISAIGNDDRSGRIP